ncbi:TetR/AcrR family transcriptional regulator [Tsukamurella sp. M9C]|uniref:TetR/AcrR family transcriptional regulator n=1 Tax=Tsukamurella sp. M9C TaxID=2877520 RepID=UPI001CC9C19A|nr:TetR/AcrR family transcriptional regulator [Tsukamurella sp. M9C]MCA0156867.1 TetR/AcrR family transcriptional regulator [Tsukamurella sp. M9C]
MSEVSERSVSVGGAPRVEAPRPLRADAQRNRDKILAVAREAFGDRGADASLDEIAKAAGVGPGTLYRHFPTRAHLHRAVLDDWQVEVAADGERLIALADVEPERALSEWAHSHYEHKSFFRGLHARLLADADDDDTSVLYSCKTALGSAGEGVLERARAAGLVRPEIGYRTVSQLISGIGMVAEQVPDGIDVAGQIGIVLAGIRPAT